MRKNETMNDKCPYSKNKICYGCKVLEVVLPLVWAFVIVFAVSLSIYLFSEGMICKAVWLSFFVFVAVINFAFSSRIIKSKKDE